jgi:hypothetical protein
MASEIMVNNGRLFSRNRRRSSRAEQADGTRVNGALSKGASPGLSRLLGLNVPQRSFKASKYPQRPRRREAGWGLAAIMSSPYHL